MELKNYTLSNGLRLAVLPNSNVRSACLLVDLHTGSRNDRSLLAGEHHGFEHMPFRGTQGFPSKLHWSTPLERHSIDVIASTGPANTRFGLEFPEDQLGLCAGHLAELAYKPLLHAADWDEERNVILRELKEHEHTPGEVWRKWFTQIIFPENSELWIGNLGTTETLANISVRKLSQLHASEYSIENSQLVLTGSLSGDWMGKIEKSFGSLVLPKGTDGRLIKTAIPRGGKKELGQHELFKEPMMLMGTWFPSTSEKEGAAISIFLTMLGNGNVMSSPLFQELREKRGLTYSFGLNLNDPLPGIEAVLFGSHVDASRAQEMEGAFWQVVEDTLNSEAAYAFAKDRASGQTKMRVFDPADEAGDVAYQILFTGYYLSDVKRDSLKRNTSFEEVRHVAQKYFDRSKFSTFLMTA